MSRQEFFFQLHNHKSRPSFPHSFFSMLQQPLRQATQCLFHDLNITLSEPSIPIRVVLNRIIGPLILFCKTIFGNNNNTTTNNNTNHHTTSTSA